MLRDLNAGLNLAEDLTALRAIFQMLCNQLPAFFAYYIIRIQRQQVLNHITLYVRDLRNNDTVAVISTKKTGDITGVVYVKDLKKKGQVSTAPAAPAAPAFQAYKVKVTANVLNIRKGAGTNYGIAGSIKDKGIYTIVAEATGKGATKWGKLKSGAGWISLDYCEKI